MIGVDSHSLTRRRFLRSSGVAGATALTAAAGCLGSGGGGGGTPTFEMGYIAPIDDTHSLFAIPEIRDEVATNLGEDYELNVQSIQSSTETINVMASGEIHLGTAAASSFTRGVLNEAVPSGINAVATVINDAHEGHYSIPGLAMSDAGFESIADLEGKKIGVNALGSGIHVIPAVLLEQNGIDPDNDVDWVELPQPATGPAIRDGTIDCGMLVPIFGVPQIQQGGVEAVFNSRDLYGSGYPFAFLTAAGRVLEDQPDALRSLLEDYAGLYDYVRNPDNQQQVREWAAEHFELPVELLEAYYLTDNDFYRPPGANLNVSRLQEVIDLYNEFGFVESSISVSDNAAVDYLPG